MARRARGPVPAGYWTIWTTVALDLVGFGIVVPILGRYAERFGAGGLEVGLMFASFSLAQMVCAPFVGRLSDRIGRKPVIIISLVGTAVGSIVTGAAGALWVLFLGRVIDGASGASVAVAQSAVADLAPPERRAELLGMLGAAFGIGFVVGPALGGLAALGGPHVPFFLAGAIAAANAVVAVFRLPETRPSRPVEPRSGARPAAMSPLLARYALVGLVASLGFAGFESTFALWGEATFSLTEGSTALVFLFVGVVMIGVQGFGIGPLTSAFGAGVLARAGLVGVAVGMLLLASAGTWAVMLAALVVLSAGQGVLSPSLASLVTDAAPENRRGEALGYQQSAAALGRIAGPVGAGFLFDSTAASAPFLAAALMAAVAFLALLRPPMPC